MTLDEFYFAINDVRPSLIRVEADEATYNLHILVRFELEQALLDGDLQAADLPDAWNEKYRQYLGITPPDDRDGVLQDVHWSAGLIGYFPTYSLGNLYAAQFFAQAETDLGDLAGHSPAAISARCSIGCAKTSTATGSVIRRRELVKRATGQPLSARPWSSISGTTGALRGVTRHLAASCGVRKRQDAASTTAIAADSNPP